MLVPCVPLLLRLATQFLMAAASFPSLVPLNQVFGMTSYRLPTLLPSDPNVRFTITRSWRSVRWCNIPFSCDPAILPKNHVPRSFASRLLPSSGYDCHWFALPFVRQSLDHLRLFLLMLPSPSLSGSRYQSPRYQHSSELTPVPTYHSGVHPSYMLLQWPKLPNRAALSTPGLSIPLRCPSYSPIASSYTSLSPKF